MSRSGITCCKDCAERQINCHCVCERYIVQKAEHEKVIERARNYRIGHALNVESSLRARCQKNSSLQPIYGFARKK